MNEPPSTSRLVLGFAVVYVVWGSTYLAIRVAVESLPPFLMAATRFFVAGAVTFAWLRLRGVPSPTALQWRNTAVVGTLLLLGGNGLVTWSEQWVPSGIAALIVAAMPLWMGLLVWIFEPGVRPGARGVAGILLGFAGVAVLVNPRGELGADPSILLGSMVLLVAPLLWACGSLYSRHVDTPKNLFLSTAMQMLAGSAALLVVGTVSGEWRSLDLAHVTTASLLALVYLIVFGSLIAFSAFVWLLRVTTPAKVTTYAYVNPVVALFLGWLILGEAISTQTFVAAGIIIAAVFLMTTDRPKRVAVVGTEPVAEIVAGE